MDRLPARAATWPAATPSGPVPIGPVPIGPVPLGPVPIGAVAVVGVGMALLLARPWALHALADPVGFLVVLFVGLGLAGALWPLPAPGSLGETPLLSPRLALAVGAAAFGVGRLVVDGPGLVTPASVLATALVLNALAAVAEEAFFRRLVYGLLDRWGTIVAVIGSAAAFGVVHVTVWGWWVLPLDLAAGLVLSWQRAATGSWVVPAVTHVVANVWALA